LWERGQKETGELFLGLARACGHVLSERRCFEYVGLRSKSCTQSFADDLEARTFQILRVFSLSSVMGLVECTLSAPEANQLGMTDIERSP
jgi:hypothetical protein